MRVMHKTRDEKLPTPAGWVRESTVFPVFKDRQGRIRAEERGLQVRMTGAIPKAWAGLVEPC